MFGAGLNGVNRVTGRFKYEWMKLACYLGIPIGAVYAFTQPKFAAYVISNRSYVIYPAEQRLDEARKQELHDMVESVRARQKEASSSSSSSSSSGIGQVSAANQASFEKAVSLADRAQMVKPGDKPSSFGLL
jgi:hypothetical protein